MLNKKKKLKLLYLKWLDPHSIDGETSVDEIDSELGVIHSVGIVIKETKELYYLAPNIASTQGETLLFFGAKILKKTILEKRVLDYDYKEQEIK